VRAGTGEGHPGAEADITAKNLRDKYQGENKILQTNPLEITRDVSVPPFEVLTYYLRVKMSN